MCCTISHYHHYIGIVFIIMYCYQVDRYAQYQQGFDSMFHTLLITISYDKYNSDTMMILRNNTTSILLTCSNTSSIMYSQMTAQQDEDMISRMDGLRHHMFIIALVV